MAYARDEEVRHNGSAIKSALGRSPASLCIILLENGFVRCSKGTDMITPGRATTYHQMLLEVQKVTATPYIAFLNIHLDTMWEITNEAGAVSPATAPSTQEDFADFCTL